MEKTIPIFGAVGIELEYMIVDRDSLVVRPICDGLMKQVLGFVAGDYENGAIGWSNELVNHVVELKTNGPAPSFEGLDALFHQNINQINDLLEKFNAMLLPSGAHPLMDPYTETKLWPHDNHEIYSLYNRIFDCRGHGWANLQSMHINLPFDGDGEFAQLHAAIRLLMPLIPALTASTPVLDGRLTGFADARLETYRHNQDKIPSIAGQVVPEAVFSKEDYSEKVFNPIIRDIKPYDAEGILDHHFLNSRGAIARFDRNAIEIRIIDLQEAPMVDLALAEFFFVVLRQMTREHWVSADQQKTASTGALADLFLKVVREGDQFEIKDGDYLRFWDINQIGLPVLSLWQMIFEQCEPELSERCKTVVRFILEHGNLSSRIVRALDGNLQPDNIRSVYHQLAKCLEENRMFVS
ncbi:MAG: carboxylate-amine ligase [Breznakibacter sp.]